MLELNTIISSVHVDINLEFIQRKSVNCIVLIVFLIET